MPFPPRPKKVAAPNPTEIITRARRARAERIEKAHSNIATRLGELKAEWTKFRATLFVFATLTDIFPGALGQGLQKADDEIAYLLGHRTEFETVWPIAKENIETKIYNREKKAAAITSIDGIPGKMNEVVEAQGAYAAALAVQKPEYPKKVR